MSNTDGPGPGPEYQPQSPPSGNWRDMRRADRDTRRAMRHGDWGGMPIGGVIILIVGLIFLAGNFGFHLPDNWWAIFVLVPAVAALVSAVRFWREDGAMTNRVAGAAIGGVLMLAVALALFFGVNWGIFWPVILIIIGAGIILRGSWRR
ncbi:MAG: hypothetical protein ABI697_04025 [Devosia sp.]